MKALAALAVLAGAGLVAGTAAGDPVPLPPVPTVTVSLPSTPVPLPALPKPSAPVVSATTSPPVASAVSQVSGAAASAPSGSSGTGSGGTSSSGSSSPSHVSHFHSAKPWISTGGSKRRRTTTFMFVLPSAARVIFTVTQVSPACAGIGRFSVAGHTGLNRVRFAGRVHGRQLTPGTYRISASTAAGQLVRRITLVVVAGSAPTRAELRSLRVANVCSTGTRATASAGTGPLQTLPAPLNQPEQAAAVHGPNLHSGVLANSVAKTARAIRPALVALLALAILLLGVASLPRVALAEPRVNELLAQHRLEIAALGAAALVAVVVSFLLS